MSREYKRIPRENISVVIFFIMSLREDKQYLLEDIIYHVSQGG